MKQIKIKISNDYSKTPGPRYKVEGGFSGEKFREEIFAPKIIEAIEKKCEIVVDLDGTAGYAHSFLEESFGGLIRKDKLKYNDIKQYLKIISEEESFLKDKIDKYLDDAKNS